MDGATSALFTTTDADSRASDARDHPGASRNEGAVVVPECPDERTARDGPGGVRHVITFATPAHRVDSLGHGLERLGARRPASAVRLPEGIARDALPRLGGLRESALGRPSAVGRGSRRETGGMAELH
jgi:hypothetical protein